MGCIGFSLPEDVTAVRSGVEAFVRAEVLPRYEQHRDLFSDPRRLYGEGGRIDDQVLALMREVRMASAKAGFFNMCVPEEIGGAGMGHLAYYAAWERIYHLCGGRAWLLGNHVVSHWAFGPSRVLAELTPRARDEMLRPMLTGEKTMCFGMSEPGAGSDAAMLKTRATPEGDGWRITGRKLWTTNAPYADYILVFAITDPERAARKKGGISGFLVPTASPGFEIESVVRMFGQPGGDEGSVVLDDIRVEPYQMVGELHEGFQIGLLGVSLGRVYNAARSVGLARWALELAVEYAKVRECFGSPIVEYQGVAFQLAESAMEVHAAHLMGLNAALLIDRGERAIKELSMAKGYAVEACVRAIDRAMQVHGAMGFTNEVALIEAWKVVRTVNVADGTNEILRRTIVQRLSRGDVEL